MFRYKTVYLLVLSVATSNSFDLVVARSKQCMKVASLSCKDFHSSIKHYDRPDDRLSSLVPHYSVHPLVDLEGGRKMRGEKEGTVTGKSIVLNGFEVGTESNTG